MFVKAMMPDKSRSKVYEVQGYVSYGVAPSTDAFDVIAEEFRPLIFDDEFVVGEGKVSWALFEDVSGDTVLVASTGDMFTLKDTGQTLERVK